MRLNASNKIVPLETQNEWVRINKNQRNPLNLNETVITDSEKHAPPLVFEGGTWLGRHLVPISGQSFEIDDQPRDKSFDPNHVDGLTNNFTLKGYNLSAPPPIGIISEGNKFNVNMSSGFHRNKACNVLGQAFYPVDIYEFENDLDKRVARNKTNHHQDLTLSQTMNDYVKEIVQAGNAGEIKKDETSVEALAYRLASGDKTPQQIKAIVSRAIKLIGTVYSNFAVYSSKKGGKAGEHTLTNWLESQGIVKQGIEHRTDEELISQGYVSYCAAEGDNKATWARAIFHGQRLGIPVWIFGYSSTRTDDLLKFRNNFKTEFVDYKNIMIDWSSSIMKSVPDDGIDEDAFCVKVAGFLNQHKLPKPSDKGRPTEIGLVNAEGKSIKFDYLGECLTLS